MPTKILEKLKKELGTIVLKSDSDSKKIYGTDWTRYFEPAPLGVVFPTSTKDVSRVLKVCQSLSISVVPSGGRTGLAAGAVAKKGELVLSLEKMNQMGEVDQTGGTLWVQAGAITESVHRHCEAFGLTWPVDFASKGSSQIGGNISTNAGGLRVIQFGPARNWVLGLTVVLMGGEILELNGALEKNNTGLDLKHLFIGTEGTLGVVTEAVLKLAPTPQSHQTLLFSVENLEAACNLLRGLRAIRDFPISAFEYMTAECMELVESSAGIRNPLNQKGGGFVLVEVETVADSQKAALEAWLEEVFSQALVLDGALAESSKDRKLFWTFREMITESISRRGMVHKNDIAVPVSQLVPFTEAFENLREKLYPGWELFYFGHLGDGNLHINVVKPESLEREEFLKKIKNADREIFELVRKHNGSISAEHGIGLVKKEFLSFSKSPNEIKVLRKMKEIFDPGGLLNPGKIFE